DELETAWRLQRTQQFLILFDLRFEPPADVRQVLRRKRALTSGPEQRTHTRGDSWLAVANRCRRLQLRKLRIDNRGYGVDEALRPCVGKVAEHDDRDIIGEITGNAGFETLPRAAVMVPGLGAGLIQEPAEAVWIGPAAFKRAWCIDPGPALALENRPSRQPAIPRDEIEYREIECPVRRGVERRRDPFLVLELAVQQTVSRSAIGNDVRLTDNPRRLHPERCENAVFQYIPVEPT